MSGLASPEFFDLAIVGGGINGCGIARDAAGRGARVLLLEQGDLAQATSSASTKLIHGGLRYLEQFAFRLVREALRERDVLQGIAPHLIEPLRFVLPHHAGLRPAPLIRLGLFLYDHLGGRERLPPARALDLTRDEAGAPLKPVYARGFEYSDCRVDDARLTILNARDAAERGARILTRSKLVEAKREAAGWRLSVEGQREPVRARILVNAAGPWVGETLALTGIAKPPEIRLVQGSHIVVPSLFAHGRAYLFQNADGRVVFAIPYRERFTLIGTTDHDYRGALDRIAADGDEIAYLCAAASEYFKDPVLPENVVWSYSGVRALAAGASGRPQDAPRDYELHLDAEGAPLLSVIGGKITTYRRLAEAALDLLKPHLPAAKAAPWTATSPLPGGDMARDGVPHLVECLRTEYPFLDAGLAARLAHAYGTRAFRLLGDARRAEDLGSRLGGDLTAREVDYLMSEEWARAADDILWRRSKLGLVLGPSEQAALADYITKALPEKCGAVFRQEAQKIKGL
jgi:glycerol-3-phosphate dehydrogenase